MNGGDVIGVIMMGVAVIGLPGAVVVWLLIGSGERRFATRASGEVGFPVSRAQAEKLLLRNAGPVTETRVDDRRVLQYERGTDTVRVVEKGAPTQWQDATGRWVFKTQPKAATAKEGSLKKTAQQTSAVLSPTADDWSI